MFEILKIYKNFRNFKLYNSYEKLQHDSYRHNYIPHKFGVFVSF